MNIFDLITNAKNKVNNGLFQRIISDDNSSVAPIQLDEYENIDPMASIRLKQSVTPRTFGERLQGRNMTYDLQTIDPDGNAQLTTINNYQPGLFDNVKSGLRNFGQGFNENLNTPISLDNFGQNRLDNGLNKGLGYRLGEGLGSAVRFLGSPLGRAALTAGIVGASGGSGLEALAYGGKAGVLNQENRMKDRMYRNEMIRSGQNSLRNTQEFATLTPNAQQQALNEVANNVNNIRGYVGDDTFKQILAAKTLQDNAEYRKMFFENQQRQNEIMNNLRRDQLERQERQDRISNNIAYERLANDRRSLDLQEERFRDALKGQKLTNAQQNALSNIAQMDTILELIEKNTKATGILQGYNPIQNKLDSYSGEQGAANIQTRAAIDKLRTEIRHALTGAQFSPKEAKEYEKFLPTNRDNPNEIKAKINGLKQMFMADPRLLGNLEAGYNPNTSTNNGLSVDNDVLNAELARRGLL